QSTELCRARDAYEVVLGQSSQGQSPRRGHTRFVCIGYPQPTEFLVTSSHDETPRTFHIPHPQQRRQIGQHFLSPDQFHPARSAISVDRPSSRELWPAYIEHGPGPTIGASTIAIRPAQGSH